MTWWSPRRRPSCAPSASSISSSSSATIRPSACRPAVTPARRTSRSPPSSSRSPPATTKPACACCVRTCPSPGILGRVCPRPCEGPCRRALVEEPITICQLHRFMADQTRAAEQEGELLLPHELKPSSGKKIAIVGGGPAGLAAAFYARLEGHAVKIYEAQAKTGGMLRYGIPSYRLPRNVLEDELNILWRMGVELETNVRLGVDFQLDELRAG